MGFLILTVLLSSFALLAIIDGFYLHILRYQLFNHKDSESEHWIHTIRATIFPLIVYCLCVIQNSQTSFYWGVFFVFVDVTMVGIDAFIEKDSRTFMGGLPRWEYILHLFVNGFHFAFIAVFLALKLTFSEARIIIIPDISYEKNFSLFRAVAVGLMPGALVLAVLHILTGIPVTKMYWNKLITVLRRKKQ